MIILLAQLSATELEADAFAMSTLLPNALKWYGSTGGQSNTGRSSAPLSAGVPDIELLSEIVTIETSGPTTTGLSPATLLQRKPGIELLPETCWRVEAVWGSANSSLGQHSLSNPGSKGVVIVKKSKEALLIWPTTLLSLSKIEARGVIFLSEEARGRVGALSSSQSLSTVSSNRHSGDSLCLGNCTPEAKLGSGDSHARRQITLAKRAEKPQITTFDVHSSNCKALIYYIYSSTIDGIHGKK